MSMEHRPFWFDLIEIDEPLTDYLGDLAAKNDALFARLHAEDEALVDIDAEGCDAWIAGRDAEYDVMSEVA